MSSQIYEGQIPDGWEVVKLGGIVEIYDNLRIPVAASLRKFGTTPYYGANGIQDYVDGFTHNGEFVLIAEDGANDLINYPVNYVNGKIWVNNHAHVVSGKNKIIDNKFLSYCLKITNFSKFLVGGTRAKLNASILKNIEILLPKDIKEQTKIAQILSDTDELINVKCELLDKKRAIKQAAAQQLLTPKPHWHTTTIGEICEISAGGDLNRLTFSPIKTDKFLNPIYSNAVSDNGLYGYSSYFDYEGNFITVTARGYIGYAAARNGKFCSIGRLLNLKPKFNISCFYVAEYINHFIDFVIESTGVPQLTAPQISKYKISLPKDKTEQEKIAQILSDIDDEISALQDEIEKLKMIKQGAMDELLSGKTRLKG